jgi:hypothetical protein
MSVTLSGLDLEDLEISIEVGLEIKRAKSREESKWVAATLSPTASSSSGTSVEHQENATEGTSTEQVNAARGTSVEHGNAAARRSPMALMPDGPLSLVLQFVIRETQVIKLMQLETLKALITLMNFLKVICLNGWPNMHIVLTERMHICVLPRIGRGSCKSTSASVISPSRVWGPFI